MEGGQQPFGVPRGMRLGRHRHGRPRSGADALQFGVARPLGAHELRRDRAPPTRPGDALAAVDPADENPPHGDAGR